MLPNKGGGQNRPDQKSALPEADFGRFPYKYIEKTPKNIGASAQNVTQQGGGAKSLGGGQIDRDSTDYLEMFSSLVKT